MLKLSNEKDSGQQMIYDWLSKQAEKDDCLKDKMNAREFTTNELLNYCCGEARKTTTGASACVANETVFEWCKHYILEGLNVGEIKTPATVKANNEKEEVKSETKEEKVKPKKPKEIKKKVEPSEEETLFNLFGDADLTGKKTDLF